MIKLEIKSKRDSVFAWSTGVLDLETLGTGTSFTELPEEEKEIVNEIVIEPIEEPIEEPSQPVKRKTAVPRVPKEKVVKEKVPRKTTTRQVKKNDDETKEEK